MNKTHTFAEGAEQVMVVRKEKRHKLVTLEYSEFLQLLKLPFSLGHSPDCPLPDDAEVIRFRLYFGAVDWGKAYVDRIELVVESETFGPVAEGDIIPHLVVESPEAIG